MSADKTALVLASDLPSPTLHVRTLSTGQDQTIALPSVPAAVALSGTNAVVAHDHSVTAVDLALGSVTKTCATTTDAFDVALSSTGIAYVAPKTAQSVSLHIVDLSTCAETLSDKAKPIWAPSHISLHPGEKALFVAAISETPTLGRCDLDGVPTCLVDAVAPRDAMHSACGGVWASADGERLYGACSGTFRVAGDVKTPLAYGGSLAGAGRLAHLSESPTAQQIVMVPAANAAPYPGDPVLDAVVRVHETSSLGFVGQYEIPPFGDAPLVLAHGRFAFLSANGATIYVIVQADPSSGILDDFAFVTMVP